MARPRITSPALAAAVADVTSGAATAQDAAERHGIPTQWRTVHRRAQEATGGARPLPAPAGVSRPPEALPAGAQAPALPQGGPPADQTIAVVRQILGARNAAALEELEEGLVAWARGPETFETWLARPLPTATLEADTLDQALRTLGQLVTRFERAGSGREASGLGEKILAAIGRVEQIKRSRPQPPRPDAVVEALRALDADAIRVIEQHLADAIAPEEIAA